MRKGGKTATRTEHRTLRNRREKRNGVIGEGRGGDERRSFRRMRSRREEEIRIEKKKHGEESRQGRERHAKQVAEKGIARSSIFLRALSLSLSCVLMTRLTPARGP